MGGGLSCDGAGARGDTKNSDGSRGSGVHRGPLVMTLPKSTSNMMLMEPLTELETTSVTGVKPVF